MGIAHDEQQPNKMAEDGSIYSQDPEIKEILENVFNLMDDNGDKHIDEDEGVAIGMAMGENEEQARKSWKAMCKDMDDDGNTTIEMEEWLGFYEKSLKDAPADKVKQMLQEMLKKIKA